MDMPVFGRQVDTTKQVKRRKECREKTRFVSGGKLTGSGSNQQADLYKGHRFACTRRIRVSILAR